jgi:ligand-binding SRPBCC domain-containing protein
MNGEHRFQTSMHLPLPREEVFPFFAEARNLERITPPELRFRITRAPEAIHAGARIEYRLRLLGVPFGWRTGIAVWDPPHRFVDQQLRGPYRLWHHTHVFTDEPSASGEPGTRIEDVVRYALPLWPAGEVAYPLVRAQVKRIFRHRERAIRGILLGA